MVCQVPTPEATVRQLRLCNHDLRRSLVLFARKRLPDGDAEDVVQDTLTDALAATQAPEDPLELRKWVFGIARRRVADHVAGMPRGQAVAQDRDATALPSGEVDAVDLVRWARSEVEGNPEDLRTLGWIVREGLFGDVRRTSLLERGHVALRQSQRPGLEQPAHDLARPRFRKRLHELDPLGLRDGPGLPPHVTRKLLRKLR